MVQFNPAITIFSHEQSFSNPTSIRQAEANISPDLAESSFAPVEGIEQSAASQRRTQSGLDGRSATPDAFNQQQQQAEQKQTELEASQTAEIKALQARDREVRAHEQTHAAAGGQFASAPRYEFTRGPNGIRYATGGSVSIDTSPVPNDPEATLRKAQIIRRAALAPTEPSNQDRAVAAQAAQLAAEAQAEIAKLAAEENSSINQSRDSGATEDDAIDNAEIANANSDTDDNSANDALNTINPVDQQTIDAQTEKSDSLKEKLISLGVIEDSQPTGGLLDFIV